jgi:hypothetical protein
MSAWREALREMRLSLVAGVWVGVLVLAVLGVLWLQIPDSHVWQFVFSIVSACGLVALFFWFCCWVFRRVMNSTAQVLWWLRWALLAGVIVAWWLLQMPIDRLVAHSELYAGYWTSRLPHWLRGLQTYERLLLLQDWAYFSLRLILTGLLLPVAVLAGAGVLRDSTKQILRAWSRWWYWVTVLVCGWIAFAASGRMMNWTPGRGLASETSSLLLRLGFVFTLGVVLAVFVLAVAAIGLRQDATASIE